MRTLVAQKCGEHARFAYVVRTGSRVCCAVDDPASLCGPCREAVQPKPAVLRALPAVVPPVRPQAASRPPAPPSLSGAIRAVRGRAGTQLEELRVKLLGRKSWDTGLVLQRQEGTNRAGVPKPPKLVTNR